MSFSTPKSQQPKPISPKDRDTLIKLIRQRERQARAEADERAAHLVSDFEGQLDTHFAYDENETWKAAADAAFRAIADAQKIVAEECVKLGIPKEFAPSINAYWAGAGEQASKSRRAELRRIAKRQIEAATATAKTQIGRKSLETQEQLMRGGLTSEAAAAFLDAMPTARDLMTELKLGEVQALMPPKNRGHFDE